MTAHPMPLFLEDADMAITNYSSYVPPPIKPKPKRKRNPKTRGKNRNWGFRQNPSPSYRQLFADLVKSGGTKSIGSWIYCTRILAAERVHGRVEMIECGTKAQLTEEGWRIARSLEEFFRPERQAHLKALKKSRMARVSGTSGMKPGPSRP